MRRSKMRRSNIKHTHGHSRKRGQSIQWAMPSFYTLRTQGRRERQMHRLDVYVQCVCECVCIYECVSLSFDLRSTTTNMLETILLHFVVCTDTRETFRIECQRWTHSHWINQRKSAFLLRTITFLFWLYDSVALLWQAFLFCCVLFYDYFACIAILNMPVCIFHSLLRRNSDTSVRYGKVNSTWKRTARLTCETTANMKLPRYIDVLSVWLTGAEDNQHKWYDCERSIDVWKFQNINEKKKTR